MSDPGLAGERTALAWQRSGLSLAATGAAVVKGVPGSGVADRPLLGAVVVAVGLLAWAVTAATERRRRRAPTRPVAVVGDMALVAGVTTAVGIVLLVVAAWPR